MEREKFEESWKDAFEKAEVSPDDRVWTHIELELEREKGGALKRRLLFYKFVAAASVVFAMAVGGAGFFYLNGPQTGSQLALEERGAAPERHDQAAQQEISPSAAGEESPSMNGGTRTDVEGPAARQTSPAAAVEEQRLATVQPEMPRNEVARTEDASRPAREAVQKGTGETMHRVVTPGMLPAVLDEERLPDLYAVDRQFDGPILAHNAAPQEPVIDPVAAMLARLEQREEDLRESAGKEEEKTSDYEQLWTSVGFAAGQFNSMHASTAGLRTMSASAQSVAAPIVDREAKASGTTYSLGVNLGTRLSDRWVLQGGVNYMTQASEYTTDNIVMTSAVHESARFMAASSNAVVRADENDLNHKIVYSAPYSVNNSLRYLSIPMQAGYLVVDKTFGVQVNAGVSTDLFLQNTVEADSDILASTSSSTGSESPYRAVNLSGLFGTELSYRFNEHYRISVNPGIRYPFNTIYKSELGIQSTPVTFDVGLRFRYIFH